MLIDEDEGAVSAIASLGVGFGDAREVEEVRSEAWELMETMLARADRSGSSDGEARPERGSVAGAGLDASSNGSSNAVASLSTSASLSISASRIDEARLDATGGCKASVVPSSERADADDVG